MISDIYKEELLNKIKNIDKLSKNNFKFESLVQEIINSKNEKAILELIKNLSNLKKENTILSIQEKIVDITEVLYKYLGSNKIDDIFNELKESTNISLEESMKKLNELIGLKSVKEQVNDLIAYNQIQQLRENNGLKKSTKTLHIAFLGNPGTAKTTVARIIGRMYKSIGLLSKGHFIEVSRTDLIAEYQGQTAIKVKKLIERAKGGVLFIDEAYSITENSNSDSYGRECLTELTKALEDYRDDLVVIVAGYPNLMEQFFDSNPGLKSRFNTFIYFDDYSIEELIKIFVYICEKNDYKVDDELYIKVKKLLNSKLNEKDPNFSNARFVRNLFDIITVQQAKRLVKLNSKLDKKELMTLKIEDAMTSY